MSIEGRRELPAGLPRALTVQQVARMLQLNPKRVYEAIQQRRIRAVQIGRQWRVPTQALLDWLETGDTPTGEPEIRLAPPARRR